MIELRVVDPAGPDAQWCIEQYFAFLDERFPDGFQAGNDLAGDRAELGPPGGAFIVAYEDDRPVGCGALRTFAADVGEIKRMWVAEPWRGQGLGARILAALEDEARRKDCTKVHLDTDDTLLPAIAMYRSRGYADVPPYNDNPYAKLWFVKELA
ncbi:MAG: GNAT family N-acetyltransferase [Nitriliruptorales bacterium]|nr:GNAT family N-acetyltransferase [Nitriliruptorales bacterium]